MGIDQRYEFMSSGLDNSKVIQTCFIWINNQYMALLLADTQ